MVVVCVGCGGWGRVTRVCVGVWGGGGEGGRRVGVDRRQDF